MGNTKIKWQFKLLRQFCKATYLEEIEGDLLEQYDKRTSENKPAETLLLIDVLKLIKPGIVGLPQPLRTRTIHMLNHNIKISFRSFKRHKTSFLINYIGLVAGLVTALFIYLWVTHELSVDRFHEEGDNLYRLVSGNDGKVVLNTNAPFSLELAESISEIDYVVNSCWGPLYSWLAVEESSFHGIGEFGSKRFFELFSYPLLVGHAPTVLETPNAIVLSESMALKLFKTKDVIGEQIDWRWYSHEEPVVVTGIFKDLPKNSSQQFDYVLNFEVYDKISSDRVKRNQSARTYLKLKDGASPEIVNQKIHDYTRATYPEYEGSPYMIIDFASYYLEDQYQNGQPAGGRIELVRLFTLIGILVLFIACINFMNLSTSRAALRMKEIGIKKAIGAGKSSLLSQYLIESCLISVVAGLTAVGMLFILLPTFERILDQQIGVDFNLSVVLGFVGIILLTGLISGSYPALYLSRFHPLKALKGSFVASSKDQWLRKGLVVFQFSSSLVLIIAVFVVYQQMQFVHTKNMGYNNDYIVNFRTTGMSGSKQKNFLNEIRKIHGVVKASGISHALFGAQKSGANMTWQGKDPEEEIWFEYGHMGYDMLDLLAIDLIEGRGFSREFGDESTKVIINQATKELMRVESAVGEKFIVNENEYKIIGVTENFHFHSLHEEIKPTFFLLNSNHWYLKIAVKVNPKQMQKTLAEIHEVYSKFNPGFPFQYSFHDQDQAKMYTSEITMSILTKYAAGLAILISSLGLFGLVSFLTERKAKEISIRKVLGASSITIMKLVTKDFILSIAIASIIGVVAAISIINQWLNGFAYRIDLKWWFFAGAISLILLVALLTSLSQILRIVMANPAHSLRNE